MAQALDRGGDGSRPSAVSTYETKIRPLVRTANLYHIFPRPDGYVWDGIEYFDPATIDGVVYIFKPNSTENTHDIVLQGLNANQNYSLTFEDGSNPNVNLPGSLLMTAGINVTLSGTDVSELMFIGPQAAATNWTGNASADWSNSGNWTGGVPAAGMSIALGTSASTGLLTAQIPVTGGTAAWITFGPNHSATISSSGGGVLTLDNGPYPAYIQVLGGTHSITAPVRLNSDAVVQLTNAGDLLTIGAAISDGGAGKGLTIGGPGYSGKLVLTAANTYGGATIVSSGTLQLQGAGCIASGTVSVASGAALILQSATALSNANLTDNGTINLNNDGAASPALAVPAGPERDRRHREAQWHCDFRSPAGILVARRWTTALRRLRQPDRQWRTVRRSDP